MQMLSLLVTQLRSSQAQKQFFLNSIGIEQLIIVDLGRDNNYLYNAQMQQKKEELWMPTPCTIPFISASASFNKSQRFKLFSIYHKDDVNKAKAVFNDIEKPELLLIQFRREIEEASSDRFKKRNQFLKRTPDGRLRFSSEKSNKSKEPSPDKIITDKLYRLRSRQDARFDRYGIRSNLEANENQEAQSKMDVKSELKSSLKSDIKSEMSQTKTSRASFLTSSHRLDLSRPLNYYPAPNSYRHTDFLSERKYIPSPGKVRSTTSQHKPKLESL